MARTELEVTFQDYDTDGIGVSKDTYINGIGATQETYNYGASTILRVAAGTWGNNHIILEVVMPDKEDIAGFSDLNKVELGLYLNGVTSSQQAVLAISEIQDDFTEGEESGTAGYCNWADRMDTVPWSGGDGAIASVYGTLDDAQQVIQSLRLYPTDDDSFVTLDMTGFLSMGDTKRFVLWLLTSTTSDPIWDFSSREHGTSAQWPKLILTYDADDPDAFENEGDKLKIEPSPGDKTQPLLKWGGYDKAGFERYKVWRWASGNSERSTLLTTITDIGTTEHIDSTATTGDSIYFYQAGVSVDVDSDDYDYISTLSSPVTLWRPSVSTFGVTSTTPDAWSTVTGTITGSVTNKPSTRRTTTFIYDWEGDASAEQIRKLSAHSATDNTTHVYTEAGAVTPRAKIESDQGFQSDYTSAATVTVGGLSPVGVLKGPLYCAKDTTYTFRGDESYDQNTDGTVDHWGWDWDYTSPFTSNVSTTVPTASHSWTTAGTKTIALRVWDNDGNNSGSVTMTTTVYDNTPTVLALSSSTRISAKEISDGENIYTRNTYLGTNYGEVVWTGKDFPIVNLNGWTDRDENGLADMDLLEDYSDSPTRLKLLVSNNNKWYTGYLTNFNESRKGGETNQFFWTAEFICEDKTND